MQDTMTVAAVLTPGFAQFGLTAILMSMMAAARTQAIRRRDVKIRDVALGQPAWPPRVTQIGNAYHNQLEMPVFFFIALGFALGLGLRTPLFVGVAWAFVAFRVAHAAIHVTSNNVPRRFAAFALANVALVGLWVLLAMRAYA